MWTTVSGWTRSLGDANVVSIALAAGTVGLVIGLRLISAKIGRRIPAAVVAMSLATALTMAFSLEQHGLRVVADLGRIPAGLPPLTIPRLDLMGPLFSLAVACAVLSLVESSSVARSISARTREAIEPSREFLGQGLSNVAAAFSGGYPVSGSLSRSSLNERAGARTRVAGILGGALMLLVLLVLSPVLNRTPMASLAGLLFVIAYDLVDVTRIRRLLRTRRSDALAFLTTMVGTWVLALDTAIYVGVAISVVLFLRRARHLEIVEMAVGADGELVERIAEEDTQRCSKVGVLRIEGALFFGASGELNTALSAYAERLADQVLVLRLERAHGLDWTAANTLAEVAAGLRSQERWLLLVGLTDQSVRVLERAGALEEIGHENVFRRESNPGAALGLALRRATKLAGDVCLDCPLLERLQPPADTVRA